MNPNMRRKPKEESRAFKIYSKRDRSTENKDDELSLTVPHLTAEQKTMQKNRMKLAEVKENRDLKENTKEVWE